MHCRKILVVAVALASMSVATPSLALSGDVILGFSATYRGPDGADRTHHGIDVAMPCGSVVESPVDGSVRFAGRIPGAAGGSVLCVSLETDEGVVTLLPLDRLEVEAGERVEAGEPLGSLAETGDASSDRPHLHLGLKRGSLYVDPSALLALPAPAPDTSAPQPETAPTPAPSPAPVPAPATPAAIPQSSPQPGVVTAPGVTVLVPSDSTAADTAGSVSQVPGRQPDGSPQGAGAPAELSEATEGVTASDGAGRAGCAAAASASTPLIRAVRLEGSSAPRGADARTPRSSGLLPLALGNLPLSVGVLAAAFASALLVVTRRSLTRHISAEGPVSDRLGTLLQHLKAGDTLCGLTSCSGPLPSQSRGH